VGRLTLRIDVGLAAELDELCEAEGVSRSEAARAAIRQYVEEHAIWRRLEEEVRDDRGGVLRRPDQRPKKTGAISRTRARP